MDSGFPLKRGGCFVVGMRELTCQQAAAETGFLQAVEMLISLLLLQSNSTVNRGTMSVHKSLIKYNVVVASISCVLEQRNNKISITKGRTDIFKTAFGKKYSTCTAKIMYLPQSRPTTAEQVKV